MEDNAALLSLKGLENLRELGEKFLGIPLAINRNPALTDIAILSAMPLMHCLATNPATT